MNQPRHLQKESIYEPSGDYWLPKKGRIVPSKECTLCGELIRTYGNTHGGFMEYGHRKGCPDEWKVIKPNQTQQ